MSSKKIMLFVGLILLLVGCSTNSDSDTAENSPDVKYTKISSTSFMDQDAANKAKRFLTKFDEIKAIKAVNTSKKLLVAIEIHHNKRFQLAELKKKFAKKLKKAFPKFKTELSTDQKIFIELDRLEEEIESNNMSNKRLEKEVRHLTKLSKEQT
ncbi:hypothetical protein ACW2QC_05165 [Virgibacillus sp. FSP13]